MFKIVPNNGTNYSASALPEKSKSVCPDLINHFQMVKNSQINIKPQWMRSRYFSPTQTNDKKQINKQIIKNFLAHTRATQTRSGSLYGSDVDHSSKDERMNRHLVSADICSIATTLGYKHSDKGFCYGIAWSSSTACIRRDGKNFIERIRYLSENARSVAENAKDPDALRKDQTRQIYYFFDTLYIASIEYTCSQELEKIIGSPNRQEVEFPGIILGHSSFTEFQVPVIRDRFIAEFNPSEFMNFLLKFKEANDGKPFAMILTDFIHATSIGFDGNQWLGSNQHSHMYSKDLGGVLGLTVRKGFYLYNKNKKMLVNIDVVSAENINLTVYRNHITTDFCNMHDKLGALGIAMHENHPQIVEIGVRNFMASDLSDHEKVSSLAVTETKLIQSFLQEGHEHIKKFGFFDTAIAKNNALSVNAYMTEIIKSKLSDKDKIKLLTNIDSDARTILEKVHQLKNFQILEIYQNSVIESNLPCDIKLSLLGGQCKFGIPYFNSSMVSIDNIDRHRDYITASKQDLLLKRKEKFARCGELDLEMSIDPATDLSEFFSREGVLIPEILLSQELQEKPLTIDISFSKLDKKAMKYIKQISQKYKLRIVFWSDSAESISSLKETLFKSTDLDIRYYSNPYLLSKKAIFDTCSGVTELFHDLAYTQSFYQDNLTRMRRIAEDCPTQVNVQDYLAEILQIRQTTSSQIENIKILNTRIEEIEAELKANNFKNILELQNIYEKGVDCDDDHYQIIGAGLNCFNAINLYYKLIDNFPNPKEKETISKIIDKRLWLSYTSFSKSITSSQSYAEANNVLRAMVLCDSKSSTPAFEEEIKYLQKLINDFSNNSDSDTGSVHDYDRDKDSMDDDSDNLSDESEQPNQQQNPVKESNVVQLNEINDSAVVYGKSALVGQEKTSQNLISAEFMEKNPIEDLMARLASPLPCNNLQASYATIERIKNIVTALSEKNLDEKQSRDLCAYLIEDKIFLQIKKRLIYNAETITAEKIKEQVSLQYILLLSILISEQYLDHLKVFEVLSKTKHLQDTSYLHLLASRIYWNNDVSKAHALSFLMESLAKNMPRNSDRKLIRTVLLSQDYYHDLPRFDNKYRDFYGRIFQDGKDLGKASLIVAQCLLKADLIPPKDEIRQAGLSKKREKKYLSATIVSSKHIPCSNLNKSIMEVKESLDQLVLQSCYTEEKTACSARLLEKKIKIKENEVHTIMYAEIESMVKQQYKKSIEKIKDKLSSPNMSTLFFQPDYHAVSLSVSKSLSDNPPQKLISEVCENMMSDEKLKKAIREKALYLLKNETTLNTSKLSDITNLIPDKGFESIQNFAQKIAKNHMENEIQKFIDKPSENRIEQEEAIVQRVEEETRKRTEVKVQERIEKKSRKQEEVIVQKVEEETRTQVKAKAQERIEEETRKRIEEASSNWEISRRITQENLRPVKQDSDGFVDINDIEHLQELSSSSSNLSAISSSSELDYSLTRKAIRRYDLNGFNE